MAQRVGVRETAKALHEIAELTPKRSLVILFTDLLDDPDKVDEIVEALRYGMCKTV